jgi:hypothetical protein
LANVHARTYPIALGLGGVLITVTSITAYEFGQRGDIVLLAIGLIIGVCLSIASIPVYHWEREKYYEDRKWPGH